MRVGGGQKGGYMGVQVGGACVGGWVNESVRVEQARRGCIKMSRQELRWIDDGTPGAAKVAVLH